VKVFTISLKLTILVGFLTSDVCSNLDTLVLTPARHYFWRDPRVPPPKLPPPKSLELQTPIFNMAEGSSPSAKPASSSPVGAPLRRVLTGDESVQLRRRPPTNRFSTTVEDAPTPGVRRRSSNFSEYSLREARKSFQSSTDDLLLPKPSAAAGHESSHDSSPWHSAPLAFALLPAIGGILFTNGSSIITDVMLLGLAAIFLNWSVRIPW